MPTIHFQAKLIKIGTWAIIQLPKDASAKLPSRGQVFVDGAINGLEFQTPLEPDGKWSHWFRLDDKLGASIRANADDTVKVTMKTIKEWPEPDVPADLKHALAAAPQAHDLWQRITPMARWEWIRWSRATNNSETRDRRIRVAISKLASGERRPCCWNRNLCTEPSVSRNGVLLEPTQASR